jgi:prepilin-type N-terminal cleavage/methylation domain-containing protein/prepilin-type processing-associated H-X9-DG protein
MSVGKRAFTLIELLVVIAIIAILAAILFPVFAQAREKARAITCLSNQKNIATSVLMYGQDYDESVVTWFVPAEYTGEPGRQRFWGAKLQPYIKNGTFNPGQQQPNGIFQCPSFSQANYLKAADAADCDGNGSPGSSGINAFPPTEFWANFGIDFEAPALCGAGTQANPLNQFAGSTGYGGTDCNGNAYNGYARSFASLVRPSETAIISDGISLIGGGFYWTSEGCEASMMHQNGGNLVFLDGHAKRISGNNQRYLRQQSDGRWYMIYHCATCE